MQFDFLIPARQAREAIGPALAATVGRVVGTVAKVGVALVVWWGLLAVMVLRLMT